MKSDIRLKGVHALAIEKPKTQQRKQISIIQLTIFIYTLEKENKEKE